MNNRRRNKSLLPNSDRDLPNRREPMPAARRRKCQKAAGAAWLFADFLAASMTLPPDQLADLE